jgi:hypothetical protein
MGGLVGFGPEGTTCVSLRLHLRPARARPGQFGMQASTFTLLPSLPSDSFQWESCVSISTGISAVGSLLAPNALPGCVGQ